MSFLPIVARELRVAARRRRIYRVRLVVGVVAILMGGIVLGAQTVAPQVPAGQALFWSLSGLAFVYALFVGRLTTADCVSEEKRDGTLGLLFLTDLKGYDVALGKLAATSLNSFYGLLTVFPVLALSLLFGGLTQGELWRMALLLINTFLFSLTVGLFASSVSRDSRRAYGSNLVLLLAVTGLPAAIAGFISVYSSSGKYLYELLVTCPAYAFYLCSERAYVGAQDLYWKTMANLHAISWLLFVLAAIAIPRSWQDAPARSRRASRGWRDFWRSLSFGRAAKQKPFRKRLLDINGYYWLAARARLKPIHVWCFLGAAIVWWIHGWIKQEPNIWFDSSVGIVLSLILNTTLKIWIAMEAGQQLAEDKQGGTMELILSTSRPVRDIFVGQLLALRRQFLGPLLLTVIIEIGLMQLTLGRYYSAQVFHTWTWGIIMLVVDIAALVMTAMSAALTAKSHHQMVFTALFRILILPWIVLGLISLVANLWAMLWSTSGNAFEWQFYLGLWVGLGLLADLGFGFLAGRRFFMCFRQLASGQLTENIAPTAKESPTKDVTVKSSNVIQSQASESEPVSAFAPRRRRRRVAYAILCLLLVAGGFWGYRKLYPPPPDPVIIRLAKGESLNNVRVYPGGNGVLFIMPDGTLWRWGLIGGSDGVRKMVPEQIGTSTNWLEARAAYNSFAGIQKDGSLWFWNEPRIGRANPGPTKFGTNLDWGGVFPGNNVSAAIKRDGSLWMWGDNRAARLPGFPPVLQMDPVRQGTDRWLSIANWSAAMVGLREDGSLWSWGQAPTFLGNPGGTPALLPSFTRICRETNWTKFVEWSPPFAINRAGEWWSLFYGPPDPEASIATNGRLFSDDVPKGQRVFGIVTIPSLSIGVYELHDDGTLWSAPNAWGWPAPVKPAFSWTRFDERSDWIAVWYYGAMFGLTSDGTLWTWGLDLGKEPSTTFQGRLNQLRVRLGRLFGTMTRGTVSSSSMPVQIKPRPLIKFVQKK